MSIRSTCEKGFHAYLAEQHKAEMDSSLRLGLSVATVCTGLLYFANEKVGLNLAGWQVLSVFPIITAFSFFPTVFTLNSEDISHKEAFDAVCGKYEKKDEDTDGE
mgnify:FL=1